MLQKATRGITTLPGRDASLSQGTQHEVTKSITTLPGWDACSSQGTKHGVTRSIATGPGWDACSTQGYLRISLSNNPRCLQSTPDKSNLQGK